eukprot:4250970-Prymnesium_polylepis.2
MSCRQAIASRCVPGTLAAHSFPRSCCDGAAAQQCELACIRMVLQREASPGTKAPRLDSLQSTPPLAGSVP